MPEDMGVLRGGPLPGKTTKSVAGSANVTLTLDDLRKECLILEGALTGNITVSLPLTADHAGYQWTIDNETTGAYTLGVKVGAGDAVSIPQGACMPVLWNGTELEHAATGLVDVEQFATDADLDSATRGAIFYRGTSNWEALQAETDTQILIGDGTDLASVAVTGDVTISNAGVTAIGADKVTNDMLANITRGRVKVGGASNAPTDLDAKTSGQILVGDGTDILSVALSGDATLAANGALTLASTLVRVAAVSLTAAQILDLADTPITLVAAPGAGQYLELVSAVLLLDHAGDGFAEDADNLEIHYENEAGAAATAAIEMTGFIDQVADTVLGVLPLAPVARAKTAVENKALVLTNINDDFTDSGTTTSVLRVRTAYRTHPTGF